MTTTYRYTKTTGQGYRAATDHQGAHGIAYPAVPALQKKSMEDEELQMKREGPVNDDPGLKHETGVMGAAVFNVVPSASHPQENVGVLGPKVSSPLRQYKAHHYRSNNVEQSVVQRERNGDLSNSAVYQRMLFPAARVGLPADLDTANFVIAEQQLNQMADANLQAELRHVKNELEKNGAKSGLLEGKTNDEKLLNITNKLLKEGPNVPEKEAMGFFEGRTAKAAVEDQPDVDPGLLAAINIWVVGDPQTGIVWSALGNHLRGKINIAGYRDFGIQSYLLLSPPQQQHFDLASPTEPGLTMAYVALAQAAFNRAAQDLGTGLGHLPDFVGTSYRQSSLDNISVFNGKIATNDLIMDETFWSTSILRGAGGAAGNWDSIGSTAHPIAYFVIAGTTGKYIAKYAKTEGEQEVLFRDRVVFRVDRIVNLKNATFFVYLTEVAPPPGGTVIKNPFTGDPY
ncbi:MAG TPA: hypothetical protein VFX43_14540 [Chitinophagaceae bacterium]|nr:hypothetical protein [Chitinophagaceae bacterium]